jgi:glyoxylase-like metal-dependent hydrolase (beta-lactamase superfamily II)/8-oxo-dGTP pyrophosphatase MutT (NUDIX family)
VNQKPAIPKDAAAVVLIRGDEVLWARRNPNIKFLGGWHAFPGGKVEAGDEEVHVENCTDADLRKFIVAAARETFEEVGVLLVRNGEKLTRGQRASLHDDLVSGRSSFAEILADWNLRIDARDFLYTGFWTTPQFSLVRFKTRFFIVECPLRQEPYAAISEMQSPEFIAPEKALEHWANAEVLISPPVLIALKTFAENNYKEISSTDSHRFRQIKIDSETKNQEVHFEKSAIKIISEKLLKKSQQCDGEINFIELAPQLICFPLKSETLPPATHTNCFIVGESGFIVIDPASSDENEQNLLHNYIDSRIRSGDICYKIFITHEHKDHIGGVLALQKHIFEKFNVKVQIAAHRLTAEQLSPEIRVDELVEDSQQMKFLSDKFGIQSVRILHTPGHARGHLCFYFEKKGFLLSSDNVVGAGTVVIAPPEGNMTDYLASLERLKNLPNLRFLCGSHGAAVFDARGKIEEYVRHRLEREKQISEAFENGAKTIEEIVGKVYVGLKPELFKYAEKSVEAHLEKLKIRL